MLKGAFFACRSAYGASVCLIEHCFFRSRLPQVSAEVSKEALLDSAVPGLQLSRGPMCGALLSGKELEV